MSDFVRDSITCEYQGHSSENTFDQHNMRRWSSEFSNMQRHVASYRENSIAVEQLKKGTEHDPRWIQRFSQIWTHPKTVLQNQGSAIEIT